MSTIIASATPTKLRSGAWGARVDTSDVSVGDIVTITTRGGKSWDARVTAVVWSGEGAAIVATESLDRAPSAPRSSSRRRGTWTGCSCGSVEEYERDGDCFSCRHDR